MIVKHPTLAGVERDVPDKDVKRWQKAGWLADEPKKATTKARAADEPDA